MEEMCTWAYPSWWFGWAPQVTGWVEGEEKEGIPEEGVGDNVVYLLSWKTQASVS